MQMKSDGPNADAYPLLWPQGREKPRHGAACGSGHKMVAVLEYPDMSIEGAFCYAALRRSSSCSALATHEDKNFERR